MVHETLKVFYPVITNLDTPSTVVLPARAIFVVATIFHRTPDNVLGSFVPTMLYQVLRARSAPARC